MTAIDKVIACPCVHAHPSWQGAPRTIAGGSFGIFLFLFWRLKKEMPPVVYTMPGRWMNSISAWN